MVFCFFGYNFLFFFLFVVVRVWGMNSPLRLGAIPLEAGL